MSPENRTYKERKITSNINKISHPISKTSDSSNCSRFIISKVERKIPRVE